MNIMNWYLERNNMFAKNTMTSTINTQSGKGLGGLLEVVCYCYMESRNLAD